MKERNESHELKQLKLRPSEEGREGRQMGVSQACAGDEPGFQPKRGENVGVCGLSRMARDNGFVCPRSWI